MREGKTIAANFQYRKSLKTFKKLVLQYRVFTVMEK